MGAMSGGSFFPADVDTQPVQESERSPGTSQWFRSIRVQERTGSLELSSLLMAKPRTGIVLEEPERNSDVMNVIWRTKGWYDCWRGDLRSDKFSSEY
jgi:hypothetical protein